MTVLTDVNVTLFEPFGDGSLFLPTQSFVHYRLSSNEEPLKDFLESGCMPNLQQDNNVLINRRERKKNGFIDAMSNGEG